MTLSDMAKGLTPAQRAFVLSLSDQWKHWPQGMARHESSGLRGFGQSGLIESRYEHSGEYHRLSNAGLQLQAYLRSIAR